MCVTIFSKHDINRFKLLLQKDAYPYECVGGWDNFNETLLPKKEDFYIHLNKKDILMQITHSQKQFLRILKH